MKSVMSLLKAHPARMAFIVALVAIAIFAGVRYVGGSGNPAQGAPGGTQVAAATAVTTANAASTNASAATTKTGSATGGSCCNGTSGASASGAGGGSCCSPGGTGGGGTGSSAPTQGAAKLTGGVQKVSVDLSTGVYNPDVINLKAGVPAEITFGQSSGCTSIVQSQDLGFQADLSGGPQTVKLPALQPGTYTFACGMNMVGGEVVVK